MTTHRKYGNFIIYIKGGAIMDAVMDILMNLLSGLELESALGTIVGSLVEYDVSACVDTIMSFFGGLFS